MQLPFHPEKQVATQARGLSKVVSCLAELAYGNRDLWYLIAEANGLANNSDIKAGDTLILPTTKLDDTPSFWLYGVDGQTGPEGELGYWSPGVSDIAKNDALWNTLPHTGGGGGGNCAILGKVLMVVAAVAVTYVTGGAAASAFGTVLGGAATGAAASVASQAVGILTGVQKDLNWSGVALGAITGGIAGGMGELAKAAVGAAPGSILSSLAGDGLGATIGRAAIGNVATQGLAVVTGLQQSFDWSAAATAAASAGINSGVGSAI